MGKIAFLFAGQGAQSPGMGKELCECSKAAAEVFAMADAIRPGTSEMCFSGSMEELSSTINTQPCVFAVDLAAAMALAQSGVKPDAVAGFSLGELAALAFAGVLSPEDAFRLVCARADLMQTAAEENPGGMAAVLRLEDSVVEDICRGFKSAWPVNYNCDGQLVVAAAADEIEAVCEAVKQAGGTAKILPVSGAFHSPFMQPAADKFKLALQCAETRDAHIPVYANFNAEPYVQPAAELMAAQIHSPVRWKQTINNLVQQGYTDFIEVGPGKTLTGLNRRICKECSSISVQDAASLEAALSQLNISE